ncbi:methyltransferase regulatory domain-containing protein [Rhodoferax sp. 4810]|uniref:Methyltransferase regulatory domain-containing protein n=2 Tax=Thiospirillum jenense TaxID=1653858 RepID=A0A839HHZ2_9GAMM|nr:methyltransferase regulatory domain-containing protein [Rhodoferax jenense]MBB1126746.1 methyltransferase regulatory domain-containing protein [Thiospirillum jenense]
MNWSHGYNTSVGYTFGYYREMSPAWIDFALRLQGYAAPTGKKRRYLELGFGQGLNLILLAVANPDIDFLGIDFNPEQVAHARKLAAGIKNVRFEEADFLNLAAHWPADYGQFDYAALHGIYTWVSPELRQAIVKCLHHAVAAGGVVYNSYNALPGWLAAFPLQHVMVRYQKTTGQPPLTAIDNSLKLMHRLREAGASLFTAQPTLANRIETAEKHDRAYLLHEYLHDGAWFPLWYSQAMNEMAQAQLVAAGTATLPEIFLPTLLPVPLRTVIEEVADPILRQELIDTAINQSFRRDLYQRGHQRLWPLEGQRVWSAISLISLTGMPEDKQLKFATSFGQLNGDPDSYGAILTALTTGPKTVAQLAALPEWQGKSFGLLLHVLSLLLHGSYIGIQQENVDLRNVTRFNRTLARAVADGANYSCVLAGQLGIGLAASTVDLMFLDVLAETPTARAETLAAGLLTRLTALGRQLLKDGTAVTDPDAARTQALQLATLFTSKTLPEWKRLGVWTA